MPCLPRCLRKGAPCLPSLTLGALSKAESCSGLLPGRSSRSSVWRRMGRPPWRVCTHLSRGGPGRSPPSLPGMSGLTRHTRSRSSSPLLATRTHTGRRSSPASPARPA
eukprot:11957850-Alexandrium_andersonii.AAC.1